MGQTNTDSETAALWAEFYDGRHPAARNRLVVRYEPLVHGVAGRIAAGQPASVERCDLASEGMIGLIDAIDKFDPDRGIQFQSYAVNRIRGAIRDGLRALDWVPRSIRAVQQETGGEVQTQVSMGDMFALDGIALREDFLRGGDVDDEDIRALLATLICELPERDAVVITLYYFEGLSLKEIGEVLSVTESRTSQLHSRATRTLRTKLNAIAGR